jgi:hypothetical protein
VVLVVVVGATVVLVVVVVGAAVVVVVLGATVELVVDDTAAAGLRSVVELVSLLHPALAPANTTVTASTPKARRIRPVELRMSCPP